MERVPGSAHNGGNPDCGRAEPEVICHDRPTALPEVVVISFLGTSDISCGW